jgi:hypothetical protein
MAGPRPSQRRPGARGTSPELAAMRSIADDARRRCPGSARPVAAFRSGAARRSPSILSDVNSLRTSGTGSLALAAQP